MKIGKQIKKFRQDLKLSQEELASKIFCNPTDNFKLREWNELSRCE